VNIGHNFGNGAIDDLYFKSYVNNEFERNMGKNLFLSPGFVLTKTI